MPIPIQNPKAEPISDEELALSLFVFIEKYGSRVIRQTATACRMISDKAEKELDGASAIAWGQAASCVGQGANYLE